MTDREQLIALLMSGAGDCSENGEIHNTQYWVGYLDGLKRLYEKITDMSAAN